MLDTATFAASWWTDQLKAPTLDDKSGGSFINTLAQMTRSVQPDVGDKSEAFKTELIRIIRADLDDGYTIVHLRVDYRPDEALQGALNVAKIGVDAVVALPWRTNMAITKSEVKVNGKLLFAVDAP